MQVALILESKESIVSNFLGEMMMTAAAERGAAKDCIIIISLPFGHRPTNMMAG